MAVSVKRGGPVCGCPYNESPTPLGSILRVPDFWKIPNRKVGDQKVGV